LNDINVEGGFDGHDGAGWDCGGDWKLQIFVFKIYIFLNFILTKPILQARR
jgi:hypothetical protein